MIYLLLILKILILESKGTKEKRSWRFQEKISAEKEGLLLNPWLLNLCYWIKISISVYHLNLIFIRWPTKLIFVLLSMTKCKIKVSTYELSGFSSESTCSSSILSSTSSLFFSKRTSMLSSLRTNKAIKSS